MRRRVSGSALYAMVDFLAMDSDVFGCVDTQTYLIAFHGQYGNGDCVADLDGFTDFPG